MKSRLVGLGGWLDAAARESGLETYDECIQNTIVDAIVEFQNDSLLRVLPTQVVMRPDGTYTGESSTLPEGLRYLTQIPAAAEGDDVIELPLPVEVHTPLDWYPEYPGEWTPLTLPTRPVLAIQRVRLFIGNQPASLLPVEWFILDPKLGQLNLVPVSGAPTSLVAAQVSQLALTYLAGSGTAGLPAAVAIDYVAGLPRNWQTHGEWAHLRRGLEECAALKVLQDIAEVFAPGIGGGNVSMWGVSQNLNYDRFQRRKQELQEAREKLLATTRPRASAVVYDFI